VKAVNTVPSVRPTTSRFRSSSTLMFASDLATAPTAGAPALLAYPHLKMAVSVLATPDKRRIRVTVIAGVTVSGLTVAFVKGCTGPLGAATHGLFVHPVRVSSDNAVAN
jgi:hypothetical protein